MLLGDSSDRLLFHFSILDTFHVCIVIRNHSYFTSVELRLKALVCDRQVSCWPFRGSGVAQDSSSRCTPSSLGGDILFLKHWKRKVTEIFSCFHKVHVFGA